MALGCASHGYTITDRAGGHVAASGVLTNVEYNRILNDSSDARVTIAVEGLNCCTELGNIRTWRHWLNIFRDGVFVWSGPIVTVSWTFDEVRVGATDLIGLLDRRVVHNLLTFARVPVSTIAAALIADGFAPDDPGHTVTIVAPTPSTGGRTYQPWIGQTADHLRDLSETGMDFVAIGANIAILPDDFDDVVGRLSDADLPEGLTVTEDGASLATRQVVAGDEETGFVGVAGGANSYYGLLEQYTEQNTLKTLDDVDQAAQAKLDGTRSVPVFIDTQDVTLAPTAPVTIEQLVPGWCLDITSGATCREITQRLKITGLSVRESGGSDTSPGSERVVVQVTAMGDELEVTAV
ncbi:minor tail protein [Streptomyces phage Xkcd426]|nr:minor tail protein [Streptomyces phage Xkcd426]